MAIRNHGSPTPFRRVSEKRAPTRADAKKPNSPEGHTDTRSGAMSRRDRAQTSRLPRAVRLSTSSPSKSKTSYAEVASAGRRWRALTASRSSQHSAPSSVCSRLGYRHRPGRSRSASSKGRVHGALAVAAIALALGRGKDAAHGSSRTVDRTARRASLFHVLLGALSTVVGAALLVYWGFVKSPTHPIDVHLGFYWTLAMGTGLSYGGFARFGSRREP
jgi:hypothetical protein